jgi:hypothetical protein
MPVRDSCTWSVQWIEPKPMHAVKIGGLLRGPLRSPRVLPPSALNLGAIRRAESSSRAEAPSCNAFHEKAG